MSSRTILDPITGIQIPDTIAFKYYPPWVLIFFQVFFWVVFVLFILYLSAHYTAHSWSFYEIARLGYREMRNAQTEIAERKDRRHKERDDSMKVDDRIKVPSYYETAEQQYSDARWRVILAAFNWLLYTTSLSLISLLIFVFLASGSTVSGWIKVQIPFVGDAKDFRDRYAVVFYVVNAVPPILIGLISMFKLIKDTLRAKLYRKKKLATLPEPVSNPTASAHPSDPTVIILVPTYKEPLPNILSTLNAITTSDYPSEKLHVYLGFDELEVQETIFTLTRLLSGEGVLKWEDSPEDDSEKTLKYNGLAQMRNKHQSDSFDANYDFRQSNHQFNNMLECPLVTSLIYNGFHLHLCRFPHGGKLSVQKHLYNLISSKIPTVYPHESFVLFIDSDTTVMKNTISNFVDHLKMNPKEMASTGIIVSRNGHSMNFWQQYQDAEYIFMQLGSRCSEAAMGGVTCLPGALTLVYYPLLAAVSKQYFNQPPIDSTFEFCRRKLGEDRYLTHLIMEYTGSYKVGFNANSICKTEAPTNFYNLLRQRRRWTLGSFTNEVYILCTPRFYFSFPFLILLRLYQTLRLSGIIFYVFLFEIIFTVTIDSNPRPAEQVLNFTVFFLYWIMVAIWAFAHRRCKVLFWVLVYFIGNLIFESVWLWYSLWTVREKAWGGPRQEQKASEEDDKSKTTQQVA